MARLTQIESIVLTQENTTIIVFVHKMSNDEAEGTICIHARKSQYGYLINDEYANIIIMEKGLTLIRVT